MTKCEKSLYDVLKKVDTSGTPWWIGLVILGILFVTLGPLFCCCYLYYRSDDKDDSEEEKGPASGLSRNTRVASISQLSENRLHQQWQISAQPVVPMVPQYPIKFEEPPPKYSDIFRTSSASAKSISLNAK